VEGLSFDSVNRGSDNLRLWSVVSDGSLRNGCEFIFKEPTKGRLIIKALEDLERYFYNVNGVHASARCGVHVHLDIKDLESEELLNLILIYMLTERLLFNWVNPDRLKNNYCRPLTDSDFKSTMYQLLNLSKGEDPVKSIIYYVSESCEKYSGLNLKPIATFGSIEFRMHQGTTEIVSLYRWINIILALKRTARDFNITTLLDRYREEGAAALLSTIFSGTGLGDNSYLTEDVGALLHRGVRDVTETLMYDSLDKTSKLLAAKKSKSVVGKRLIDKFINKFSINK
jgi:hypothetical protein